MLADDGKFDLFRDLVRIFMGVEKIENITAENLSVKVNEEWVPVIKNTLDGDKVTYLVNGAEVTDFSFSEAGKYTVSFTVEREFADTYSGSFTVEVKADEPADSSQSSSSVTGKPNKSCGGNVGAESFVFMLSAIACAVAITAVKRKYSL